MKQRLSWTVLASAGVLAGFPGCKHCCRRPCPPRCPPPAVCAPVVPAPGPFAAPPPPAQFGRVTPAPYNPAAPPPPPPPEVRNYPPPLPPPPPSPPDSWKTAPGAEPAPAAPQPPAYQPDTDPARLLPPEPAPPPPETVKPSGLEVNAASPALPVSIPFYAQARDQVASGLKPLLEGLDWLRDNGYRAVLHVRRPGEDDAADRRQAEKRGLKFFSLEVSREELSPQTVAEFNRLVTDPANLPLFVYDRDGSRAGPLWYVHFRLVERAADEEARFKSGRLGFQKDLKGDDTSLWLSIQKLLSDQHPEKI